MHYGWYSAAGSHLVRINGQRSIYADVPEWLLKCNSLAGWHKPLNANGMTEEDIQNWM